jgi:hypothetical protein
MPTEISSSRSAPPEFGTLIEAGGIAGEALLTRDQLLDLLNANGIPIGHSTLVKLCAPSCGEGPPIEAWWGKRPLYSAKKGLAWAYARLRPERHHLADPATIAAGAPQPRIAERPGGQPQGHRVPSSKARLSAGATA